MKKFHSLLIFTTKSTTILKKQVIKKLDRVVNSVIGTSICSVSICPVLLLSCYSRPVYLCSYFFCYSICFYKPLFMLCDYVISQILDFATSISKHVISCNYVNIPLLKFDSNSLDYVQRIFYNNKSIINSAFCSVASNP